MQKKKEKKVKIGKCILINRVVTTGVMLDGNYANSPATWIPYNVTG
jgi:hypothetical protein